MGRETGGVSPFEQLEVALRISDEHLDPVVDLKPFHLEVDHAVRFGSDIEGDVRELDDLVEPNRPFLSVDVSVVLGQDQGEAI